MEDTAETLEKVRQAPLGEQDPDTVLRIMRRVIPEEQDPLDVAAFNSAL